VENIRFMHRCLDLARQGRGAVGNGALVGAVLVRGESVIAEAFHEGFGQAHAERKLLENYSGAIEKDDVLYVNLEPCCHTGKTPPCTNILIERGVNNVVYGMRDPDVRVSGKGTELLRSKNVNIELSSVRAECEFVNKGFARVRTHQRPWITMKSATDQHGNVCNDDGTPKKITSAEQNTWSHTFLRSEHDAIAIGIGTLLSDNPQLNRRLAQTFSYESGLNDKSSLKNYQPYRLLFDRQFRASLSATLFSDEHASKTIVCVSEATLKKEKEKATELTARGVTMFPIETDDQGFVWESLWSALTTPVDGFNGLTSVLVEGGKATWEKFRSAGMIDEEVRLIGQ
jgi:diaminohydroxyphosphoribosylaminopyrimidine deaminase/5-amino-6-(5-phosphoribosylamino)uracil reductase